MYFAQTRQNLKFTLEREKSWFGGGSRVFQCFLKFTLGPRSGGKLVFTNFYVIVNVFLKLFSSILLLHLCFKAFFGFRGKLFFYYIFIFFDFSAIWGLLAAAIFSGASNCVSLSFSGLKRQTKRLESTDWANQEIKPGPSGSNQFNQSRKSPKSNSNQIRLILRLLSIDYCI